MQPEKRRRAAHGVESLSWDLREGRLDIEFPRLKALSMMSTGEYYSDSIRQLAQIVKTSSSLKSLELYRFAFREDSEKEELVDLLWKLLKDGKHKLHTLRLAESVDWFSTEMLRPLLESNNGWSNLETLEIKTSASDVEKLLPFLLSIRDLSLSTGGDSIEYLQLIPNPHLQRLRIDVPLDESVSCRPLLGLRFESLRVFELCCRSEDFTEHDLQTVVKNFPELRELYLTILGCVFSIATLNAIGASCLCIEVLSLPQGSYDLSALYEDFPRLHSLDFGMGLLDGSQDSDVVLTARVLRRLFPSLSSIKDNYMNQDLYSTTIRALILQPGTEYLKFTMSVQSDDAGFLDSPLANFDHVFSISDLSRLLSGPDSSASHQNRDLSGNDVIV